MGLLAAVAMVCAICNVTMSGFSDHQGCFVDATLSSYQSFENAGCPESSRFESYFECIRDFGNLTEMYPGVCSSKAPPLPALVPSVSVDAPPLLFSSPLFRPPVFEEALFNRSQVAQVLLDLSDQDWWHILQLDAGDAFAECTVTVRRPGRPTETRQGKLRRAGSSSRAEAQPGLHLHVTGPGLLGHQRVLFKSLSRDPSAARELMALDTYRMAGIPSARGSLVELFVNHRPQGVMVLLEDDHHASFVASRGWPSPTVVLKCDDDWTAASCDGPAHPRLNV